MTTASLQSLAHPPHRPTAALIQVPPSIVTHIQIIIDWQHAKGFLFFFFFFSYYQVSKGGDKNVTQTISDINIHKYN